MAHHLMEMKIIHLQRAEFRDSPKIKVKNVCSKPVHFAEISFQQLKMPDNIGAWICLPRPSLTHHQTGHAERCYRQHKVLHGFLQTLSHLSHMLRVNLLSSVKSIGHQWRTCQFWCLIENANQAPQCPAVSTEHTRGC